MDTVEIIRIVPIVRSPLDSCRGRRVRNMTSLSLQPRTIQFPSTPRTKSK